MTATIAHDPTSAGICGRCNIGSKLVCVDGPVFSYDQLRDLPPEL